MNEMIGIGIMMGCFFIGLAWSMVTDIKEKNKLNIKEIEMSMCEQCKNKIFINKD